MESTIIIISKLIISFADFACRARNLKKLKSPFGEY